jgi:hypothetical protein
VCRQNTDLVLEILALRHLLSVFKQSIHSRDLPLMKNCFHQDAVFAAQVNQGLSTPDGIWAKRRPARASVPCPIPEHIVPIRPYFVRCGRRLSVTFASVSPIAQAGFAGKVHD